MIPTHEAEIWSQIERAARSGELGGDARLPLPARVVLGELAYRYQTDAPIGAIAALGADLGLSPEAMKRALDVITDLKLVSVRTGGGRPARWAFHTLDAEALLGSRPTSTGPSKPRQTAASGSEGSRPGAPRARAATLSSSSPSASSTNGPAAVPATPVGDSWELPATELEVRRRQDAALAVFRENPAVHLTSAHKAEIEDFIRGGLPPSCFEHAKWATIEHGAKGFVYARKVLAEDQTLRRRWQRDGTAWNKVDAWEDLYADDIEGRSGDGTTQSPPASLADYRLRAGANP